MKSNRINAGWLMLLALSPFTLQPSTVQAQGTAFTYEGRLQNNGSPASGTYNLTFSLFNTNTSGVAIAGPVTNNAVAVANGLFTVLIDFGPGAFTGATNWLEIAVETNGVNTFTTLTLRQQLTPTPYAIYAESASSLSGTLLASQLTSIGNTNYGHDNFFVGPSGNSTTTGWGNTANGNEALHSNTVGQQNTANGWNALYYNTGGFVNTANGWSALLRNTIGSGNTANGAWALAENTSGYANTANGYGALNDNTIGSYNTADGASALIFNTSGSNNIALGYQAGYNITTGSYNIDIGNPGVADENNIIRIGSDQSQTFIAGVINGNGGGLTNVSAAQLTSIGNTHGYGNNFFVGPSGNSTTTGGYNTANGYAALASNTSGFDNTANGWAALYANTGGYDNTANGYAALYVNTSGSYNTANGSRALQNTTNGFNNTANGWAALGASTSGHDNIALGYQAGYNISTGSSNIDIGNEGFSTDANIIRIGDQQVQTFIAGVINGNGGGLINVNAASLSGSLADARLSANVALFNAIQTFSGQNTFTGNVGIGATSPAHKLVVQADDGGIFYDAQQIIIQGNSNNSQQLELGYKTSGNYGSIQAVQQNVGFRPLVLQPSGGNLGIGTTSPSYPLTMNSGAYCSAAGVWTSVSDRNAKEAFTAIDPRTVLEKVSALPITEWKYKVEADGSKHLGPMAQDFHAAFGLNGADDKHIATVDEEGVALAAIQGLNQKLNEKDAEIQGLKQSVAELRAMVEKLAGK